MSIIQTDWLLNNLDKVKILDCSWHLPKVKRNSLKEFQKEHIPNAIFFDLDKNSELNSDLPHMLPDKETWEKNISILGIKNNDRIIIYDNSDLISSCRCWYNFIYFGHDPKLVSVLDGGFKKWKREGKTISNKIQQITKSNYKANELINLVKNKKQIEDNILSKEFVVIDARNKNRFKGIEPEPRKNVRSGSIKDSVCLPFREVISDDGTFKDAKLISDKFKDVIGNNNQKQIVFSCGSGVTAAVLALAYSLINNKYNISIYDGSWAEYGKFLK